MITNEEILNASILIVDDQKSNVLLLEEILRDAGYTRIASTTDPKAVCDQYRVNRYDLILLDLHMPIMDGLQVMECLKEIETESYIPVLVITAKPDQKIQALAAGARDFIAKPFDLVEVQTRIRNMLEVRLLYNKLANYNRILEQTVDERTAELHASEMRFRRLTELSSDWYWEQNEKGNFTKVFGPVFEMLGIKIDDALNKTREDYNAKWNEIERNTLEENLSSMRPFLDFVYSRTLSDGSQQYLMVSGEPMFNTFGQFTGYRGIGKDVTESIHPNDESLPGN